ncbi:MAG: RNase adaptor protein RapZ, partial [Rhodobacteraceae bacterium]|nr:RNase adaptor protein RapZ [Paracoccaceae bacterium]
RRHPLAPAETPHDGIDRERDLLNEIQDASTVVLDTSDMSPHDLRAQVDRFFNRGGESKLAITIHSFSYKRGAPAGIDMVFDCRFLNNPYWDPSLRSLNGRSDGVQRFVQNDTRFEEFFAKVMDLSVFLLPAYVDEGKTHFSIGFGCTGGQHRSVALAETVAKALANHGWVVSVRHRELERRAKR